MNLLSLGQCCRLLIRGTICLLGRMPFRVALFHGTFVLLLRCSFVTLFRSSLLVLHPVDIFFGGLLAGNFSFDRYLFLDVVIAFGFQSLVRRRWTLGSR